MQLLLQELAAMVAWIINCVEPNFGCDFDFWVRASGVCVSMYLRCILQVYVGLVASLPWPLVSQCLSDTQQKVEGNEVVLMKLRVTAPQ